MPRTEAFGVRSSSLVIFLVPIRCFGGADPSPRPANVDQRLSHLVRPGQTCEDVISRSMRRLSVAQGVSLGLV